MSALAEPRWRLFGLADLIDGHADHALPILVEQAEREKDAGVRVAEIHLISAYRDPASAEALLKHLDAADALTRAAAIDSLGILYAPAYPIPNGENQSWSGGELRTDPSVELRNIISLVNQRTLGPGDRNPSLLPLSADPIAMPTGLRERLSGLMLNGPTVEEREAAARAMLSQPAAGYALRYAEWGVWLASDADPNLHMVPAIEEIPPFVHRMGNPVATLRDHVLEKIIIINKPVIHLTASVPMAVDLETRIHLGRPWFAYPKPDDFSVGVEAQTVGGKLEISSNEDLHNPLAALDKADLASLPDAREGHPWLLPAHRQRDTPGSNNYNSINLIKALGVRWQSAIVSPQKLSWMQPPVVPEDQRFGWWSRLREVDCSWVSSRGEAERFLYYDGPTIAPTRCEVYIDKGQLRFSPNMDLPLPGILVEVKEGKAVGTTVNIAAGLLAMDLSKLRSEMKLNAREQLLALLLKGGLKSAEAEGLLDCWAPQFFNTPGLRFIAVFGTAEYDKLCPMELRPAATERARVGLQLKEFR